MFSLSTSGTPPFRFDAAKVRTIQQVQNIFLCFLGENNCFLDYYQTM